MRSGGATVILRLLSVGSLIAMACMVHLTNMSERRPATAAVLPLQEPPSLLETNLAVPCKQEDSHYLKELLWKGENDTYRMLTQKTKFRGLGEDSVILLASFPRSGNSLLRLLVEKATGTWTGSIYKDSRLTKSGFKGEFSQDPKEVVFVKSHQPLSREDLNPLKPNISGVILMVRNPFPVVVSFVHYLRSGAHDKNAPNLTATDWEPVLHDIFKWNNLTIHWRKMQQKYGFPMHYLRYEDLLSDPELEMYRILKFLELEHFPYFRQRASCAVRTTLEDEEHREGGYSPREGSPGDSLDVALNKMTQQQIDRVWNQVKQLYCELGYRAPPNHSCDEVLLKN